MSDSVLGKRSMNPESELIIQRDRTNSTQSMLKNVPPGISFLAMMNSRNRYFLPSTHNFFGKVKVKKVLCDSGCSTLLLPIELGSLDNIFLEHQVNHDFEISLSKNVGGTSPCLCIISRGPSSFMTGELCKDLLDCPPIQISKLRFSLCVDDVKDILSKYQDRFSDADISRLSNSTAPVERRTHALLGQSLLHGFTLIKHKNCELYLDATIYQLPTDFKQLAIQIRELTQQITLVLPEDFNDWEDDDFFFEDDICVNEEIH